MKSVYERVVAWNELRYDQVYNHELACKLLQEEFDEWLAAGDNEVDSLDALCDIRYVAYGILWKLNVSHELTDSLIPTAIQLAEEYSTISYFSPGFMVGALINKFEFEKNADLPFLCLCIIFTCVAEKMDMGLSADQVDEAMLIVCDSNDTKAIKKTDSAVKANVDKGALFIAPENRLELLLAERENA